ncbi:hypothetical protein AMATHDRAFT_52137 [Amanita thiersii Skay4041]|uniref:N-acetyltransferase domain-containing protein n=1 Tax=Amanita thiersii Skay4041 TaxID=703135 RepID=A0A2A9P1L3_9AGAR|nr:hypothetical protein AMATHDRAFT_52137 [Amanita thiersii Skay4041]
MSERSVIIRPLKASDEKLVRFVIGKAALEPLACANHWDYLHPLSLSIWMALSAVFVHFMKWWPSGAHGILGYLRPLPAIAAFALPVIFFIDWINRPDFEKRTQAILHQADMVDILNYYAKPSSGLWILDFGNKFVGLIALDATGDSDSEKKAKTSSRRSKQPALQAMIRHFYVDEPYRTTGIQDDLLQYAIRQTFESGANIKSIQAESTALLPYIKKSLVPVGFKPIGRSRKVGLFGWQFEEMVLDRSCWEEKQ